MSFFTRRSKSKSKLKEKEKENISATGYSSSYKFSQSASASPATTSAYKQTHSTTPSTNANAQSSKPVKANVPTAPSNARGPTRTEPKTQATSSRTEGATAAPTEATSSKPPGRQDSSDEVFADGPVTVPPGYKEKSERANRREKTMSISKSGRHKFRGRQRSSVLDGDVFGEGSSRTLSSTGSYESGATCRDIEPAGSSGFALAPGQATAV